MPTKRGKKSRSALRNIVLILLFIVPVTGLIVAVPALRREVVLMLPEEHEIRLAQRVSPDNALPILAFAIKQLPAKPGLEKRSPLYATEKWWNDRYDASLMQLGRSMAALGRVLFPELPSPATLQPLIDAIRLARLLSRENDMFAVSQSIEGPPLQQIRYLTVHMDQAPLLARMLNEVGPGYLPRRDVLRTLWIDLDDQIGRQSNGSGLGAYQQRIFRSVAISYDIQRLVANMKDHRDELIKVADRPPSEMVAWMCNANGRKHAPDDLGKNERRVVMALHRAAQISSDFIATQIRLALESCKAETGQYPPTPDTLAPQYMEAVPQDPYTLAPFGYKPADAFYTLYSHGQDLVDNGGDALQDRIIISPGRI